MEQIYKQTLQLTQIFAMMILEQENTFKENIFYSVLFLQSFTFFVVHNKGCEI